MDAGTVLRRTRDAVDRLAALSDEARPIGLDGEVIILRQPTQPSHEDTRSVSFALKMRAFAEAAAAQAQTFAEYLCGAAATEKEVQLQDPAREGEHDESSGEEHKDADISPSPNHEEAQSRSRRITTSIPSLHDIFAEVFNDCDGDFAETTSYLRVNVEVPYLRKFTCLFVSFCTHTY